MRKLLSSVNARRLGQVGVDACLLAAAYYLAYVLRFDEGIPHRYDNLLADTIAVTVAMKIAIFAMFGLYSKLWRFVDQKDFVAILKAVVVSTVGLIAVLFLFSIGRVSPPRSVIALDFLLSLVFVSGARFAVRALVERPARGPFLERAANEVLIVGAGNGGQQVAFELRRNPALHSAAVGFVDDDPRKQGMRVAGHKVLGTTNDLARVLDGVQPDEVIIAIPSASCARRSLPPAGIAPFPCARFPPPSSCSPVASTSCASCGRCAWRTCSAASRCGWRSTVWAPTCPGGWCW